MRDPLGILRVGIFCPVGLRAEPAAAAIRAGIMRKTETPIVDSSLEPVVMGWVPDPVLPPLVRPLDDLRVGLTTLQMRLLRLASPALQEVLDVEVEREVEPGRPEPRYGSRLLPAGASSPPLLIAGPQSAPGPPPIFGGDLLGRVVRQAGVPVDVVASRAFPTGHAGFFSALEYARSELFASGKAQLAVVGGVDSYLDLERLSGLEQEQRLPGPQPRDSFTPGEGAAFVLIAPRSICRNLGLTPLAWIDALGLGTEPGHRYSSEPFRGDGLALALTRAFADRGDEAGPVRSVMAGFTGESCHPREWGVAQLRHAEHFAEPLSIEHPAEYTGDMGAALAPMMLAVATLGLTRDRLAGPSLVWASSEWAERGALVVRRGA